MSENGKIYTAGKNFTLPPALTALTNSTSDVKIHYISLAWRNICYVELNNPGVPTFQNVPNQQCRDFHPTWKFRAGTVPRLPAGRWCWWPTMVLVGKLRSTSSIHNDGAATAFWRQSPKPCWEHARSTLRHTAQTEEKVGQGCSPSRGKLGRGATSAPCPLEIRQSFHVQFL